MPLSRKLFLSFAGIIVLILLAVKVVQGLITGSN